MAAGAATRDVRDNKSGKTKPVVHVVFQKSPEDSVTNNLFLLKKREMRRNTKYEKGGKGGNQLCQVK